MPDSRRKFDPEFREGAVRIVRETGKPIAQIARDLGVHPGTLANWVAKDRAEHGGAQELSTGDAAELKRLRSENAQLRMERDVLKRSVVLWVNEATRRRGDEARFVADQRTMHRVPHTVACAVLGISISWFHKWIGRGPTERAARRAARDARVRECFEASGRTYGSPRIHADLREAGETVSVNTVADSMRRQGLAGRKPTRRRGLTRQDPKAPKFPDLVCRDFTASAPNAKWCGAITEIPTDQGKLFLATVLDLHSRRLLGCATSDHPDAELACDAIKMAAAVRGGRAAIDGVIFHTDRGSTYTATAFTTLCRRLGVTQSVGRVGSCFDNAAAEAFFSTLEHEVLSRYHFTTKAHARQVVVAWCQDFYNTRRRHSSAALMSPVEYERLAADQPATA